MSLLTIDGHRHTTNASVDYLRLIAKMPLKPIGSAAEYDRVAAMIDQLALKPGLTHGKRDYLDALTVFVETYDDAEHDITDKAQMVKLARHFRVDAGVFLG